MIEKPAFYTRLFGLFIVLVLSQSCLESEKTLETKLYWDSSNFFSSLEEDFSSRNVAALKDACLNGECDTLQESKPKWKGIFAPFIGNDINKSAWTGLFDSDTVLKDGIRVIEYSSLDETLPVKSVVLQFDENGKLLSYKSKRSEENPVYASEQLLYYSSEGHIRLNGFMKVVRVDTTVYSLNYSFSP